ncbi:MAG: hypothetical protein MJ223_03150 [Mycoplasmoidaceae bacterium]|nr:hypothetical protein [Mycoplasmoidaceae bacterium]
MYDLVRMFEVPDEKDVLAIKSIYETYQRRLLAADQLDFSDLINFAHLLLKTKEKIRLK